jgi:class 3 adenylate cyclase
MSPPLGWSHISLELRVHELARWYGQLASRRTVVRYDPRCQGLSDREVERIGEAELTSDVEAVIERLDRPQVDLLGAYGLGPPMVRVAAEHPNEVRKLVLCNPNVIGELAYGGERGLALRRLIDSDWDLFTNTFARVSLGWSAREAQQAGDWAAYIRRAVGQRDAALILDGMAKIDWRPWLHKILAPTLVLRDPVPFSGSEVRWADIADVRLVELQDRRPLYMSEAGHAAIDEFLDEGREPQAPELPSGMTAILFADIVDSTALTERLGDAAFRDKARELDGALRTVIRDNAGTPIEGKLLGDGVLAVFTSARQAIEAALACGEAGRHAGLPLHLGLHAGDVIRESDPDGRSNVYGGAVNIASRISGLSAPGEVLVSETVRSLARTSAGVTFEDRGEQALKGVGEPVRVWAVREDDG